MIVIFIAYVMLVPFKQRGKVTEIYGKCFDFKLFQAYSKPKFCK